MKNWTTQDTEKLLSLSGKHSVRELSQIFGRCEKTIVWQCIKHGIRTKSPYARLSATNSLILKYAEQWGVKATCDHFGISRYALYGIRKRNANRIYKNAKALNTNLVVNLRSNCIVFARRRGWSMQEAEDFASFSVIKAIENGLQKIPSAKILMYEFLKQSCNKAAHVLDDEIHKAKDVSCVSQIETQGLTPLERSVRLLIIKYGFKASEVSEVLGISEESVVKVLDQ